MPTTSPEISPNRKAALLECFSAATRLVPCQLRSQFILVGGFASVAHSSRRLTKDVDVAGSPSALYHFEQAVEKGALRFKRYPHNLFEFESCLGFRVKMELLALGGPFVESITNSIPFYGGFVASIPDLFLLRAVTVADRGEARDVEDFKWLLEKMCLKGSVLPGGFQVAAREDVFKGVGSTRDWPGEAI